MKDINDEKIERLYTVKKYKKVRKMTSDEKIEHEKQIRKDRNARYYLNKQLAKTYGKEYVPKMQKKKYVLKTIPVSSAMENVGDQDSDNESDGEGSLAEHYELLLDLYDLNDTDFDEEIQILEEYFSV